MIFFVTSIMGNTTGISHSDYKKGFKYSSVIAFCSLMRGILSFVPTILIAKKIGLGNITDAYLMAFSINQIIIKFTRVGTLPKIFTMVLSDDFVKSKKTTEENINIFLNIFLIFSVLIMFFVYFTAPVLVNTIAKGFDTEKRLFTVNIVRLLIPLFFYQILISLFEAIFKLFSEFSRWAILMLISPLIINVAVILYISKLGIYSMIYGILAGCFIHLALLLYYIYFKFGFSYRFIVNFKHKLLKEIPVLLYPYYLSSVPAQLTLGIQSFLVSMLPAGVTSVYFYALRIQDYVELYTLNIFSEIAFPYFVKKMAILSVEAVKKIYAELICFPNYIFLPILIILAVFGRQIVDMLFSSKFTDPQTISLLGATFSCFVVFFLPEVANNMQTNVILAMKKTGLANIVNVSRMIVVIILSFYLFKYFKFWGIIFSYSLTYLQGFLINQWYIEKKYSFEKIFFHKGFQKIILLNTFLAIFCLCLNYFLYHNFQSIYLYQKIITVTTVTFLSVSFYILMSYLFKTDELRILLTLIKAKK